MSYILDPPQIITPVNAQGLKRVEVMGRGQAGLVKISGSGAGSIPGSPAVDGIHSPTLSSTAGASTASSPTTPKAFAGQPSIAQQQATADPFSDLHEASTSRFSVGGIAAPSSSSPDARRASQSTITSTSSQPHSLDPSNTSRWTTSSVDSSRRGSGESVTLEMDPLHPGQLVHSAGQRGSFDVPSSARSSEAYSLRRAGEQEEDGEGATGSRSRRLTGESNWTEGTSFIGDRRESGSTVGGGGGSPRGSFVSSRSGATDSMSMLDGIPFMGPASSANLPRFSTNSASTTNSSNADGTVQAPKSPLFPMPPPRSPSFMSAGPGGPPSPAISDLPTAEAEEEPLVPIPVPVPAPSSSAATRLGLNSSSFTSTAEEDDDEPLPAPFLPFAGQRPSSSAPSGFENDNRDSQAISLRSGFASGLSDVAFRLDGGLRDSMFTEGGPTSERGSVLGPSSSVGGAGGERTSLMSLAGEGGGGTRDSIHDVSHLEGVREEEGPSRPTSYASTLGEEDEEEEEEEAVIVTSAVRAPIIRSTSIKRSAPTSSSPPAPAATEADAESTNPFGDEAAISSAPDYSRASMDSLALSAALSRSLEEAD